MLDYVTGKAKQPHEEKKEEFAEWSNKDNIATHLIFKNVDGEQMIHISKCKTAAEMWINLKRVYETHSKQAACTIQCSMIAMHATPKMDIRKYLTEWKKKTSPTRNDGTRFPR